MVKNNLNGHVGSDGSDIPTRIEREKYKWGFYGENVANGQETVENVMKAFMGSKVHKDNILYDRFKHFGAGFVSGRDQWVQVFGAAREGVEFCDPSTAPTPTPPVKPTKKPTENKKNKNKNKTNNKNKKKKTSPPKVTASPTLKENKNW